MTCVWDRRTSPEGWRHDDAAAEGFRRTMDTDIIALRDVNHNELPPP
jgi:hypothetical protein